jgi:2-polyprenyl-3-methyl-5-hydroxy-6-metoxy-1,4-benzoquinol methylase
MNKLVVAMLAGNCEKTIDLAIKSVVDVADDIVIIYDTSSKDGTYDKMNQWIQDSEKIMVIRRKYEHNYKCKTANSDARNFYLDYLKKNHLGDVCLVLDADEVVGDGLKEFKENMNDYFKDRNDDLEYNIYSPKMEHFIGNLGEVDASVPEHYVQNRLFKVEEDMFYPDGEHPVLNSKKGFYQYPMNDFIIYHLAYCREMEYIRDRWLNHLNKSEVHSEDFLTKWYHAHLLGRYPRKPYNPDDLPKILKEHFKIDEDFLYFQGRGNLETKHMIDAADWVAEFKPKNALVVGDGLGMRTFALRRMGVDARGFDISEYAVKNNIGKFPEDIYWQDDISEFESVGLNDLVIVYDVMEHIDDTDAALQRIKQNGKNFLFSIPFIGDPNLDKDPTHVVKETKEWWIKKLEEHGFKILKTPDHWLYKPQLIVAEK